MRKYFLYLFFISGSFLCIYLLEGACFRLVERYANFRLKMAWGEPGRESFNPYLKRLSLDHFQEPPASLQNGSYPSFKVLEEHRYASKIMSFGRAFRDRYLEETKSAFDPLSNFEIKDLEFIKNVVMPGLSRPATQTEVIRKLARRLGDSIDVAEGFFICLVKDSKDLDFSEKFTALEPTFGFLVKNGIACSLLPITSSSDLIDKVNILQNNYPLIAKNCFAFGEGICANYLLESCRDEPDLFKAILLDDPIVSVNPTLPPSSPLPWTLARINEEIMKDVDFCEAMLKWVFRARVSELPYPSRLGGLLRLNSEEKSQTISSFFVLYLLECLKYIQQAGNVRPFVSSYLPADEPRELVEKKTTVVSSGESRKFDLKKIENAMNEIVQYKGNNKNTEQDIFECDIVKGYRELNGADPNLSLVSNRDLILEIGMGFERMGEGVLEEVGERDPLFLRFYKSLRMVEGASYPMN